MGPRTAAPAPADHVTEAEVRDLLTIVDAATAAYINGDIDRYLTLFDHADDYSLMPPYGGPTEHGFHPTEEALAELRRFFAHGEGRFELDQTYVSGSMVVVVGVERQHGEVDGSPDQDWSLRVTLVLRRLDDGWALVHRHADPLVERIAWDDFGRLARGPQD